MFGTWENKMVEAVKQAARDVVCELVSSFPIPEALSHAEVLESCTRCRARWTRQSGSIGPSSKSARMSRKIADTPLDLSSPSFGTSRIMP
jgi:hypothetical protein